ncbi:putative baseplate assembly protein [Streptomyces hirsutus]|uniref:putative baseplate assembly protein n=1 Tax=Streptomyces hirsutus TaxID=35620 RepID=UPI00386BF616|nr:putative baseplate assembly protein [Streptomyces hirsutus]
MTPAAPGPEGRGTPDGPGGHRRALAAAKGLNGIDGIEAAEPDPAEGTVVLRVRLLGAVPQRLTTAHLRIDTEPGARPPRVLAVRAEAERPPGDDAEGCLEVVLDRPCDPAAACHLALVEPGADGRPGREPLRGFDSRLHSAAFGPGADPDSRVPGPRAPAPAPPLDYLAKDYRSFLGLMLDRLSLTSPAWRERHAPDLGVTLAELLAHTADRLSYYQDAVATEAYLATARRRISVRRHARLVDYRLHEGCNARAFVAVEVDREPVPAWRADDVVLLTSYDGAPPPGRALRWEELPQRAVDGGHCFEPLPADPAAPLDLTPAHNLIRIHDWGERPHVLPAGATSAVLVDDDGTGSRWLRLRASDLLLLEEAAGPRTGRPGDADPAHRHVVRIARVRRDRDEVLDTDLLEVRWPAEDALPFPLHVCAVGPAPERRPLPDVGVARGNVLAVDHGARVEEPLGPVPAAAHPPRPGDRYGPADDEPPVGPFRPALSRPDVVHAEPPPGPAPCGCPHPAAALLRRDPRRALPAVLLTGPDARWRAAPDLLAAGPDDRAFVVETDDERVSWLRFGDGRSGRRPTAGTPFTARYRIGAGPAGNVGADRIVHLALRPTATDRDLPVRARNPLPAAGGTPPEECSAARAAAPVAFRAVRERAVVAGDYAELARRAGGDRVRQAAADLVWTGSWYEAVVALDPRASAARDCGCPAGGAGGARAEAEVTAALERARRLGHDLRVTAAAEVPVELELTVCVRPEHVCARVAQALREEFSAAVLPGGRLGRFHPDLWGFGDAVEIGDLLAAAQAVPGVDSAEVTVLRRWGEPDRGALAAGFLAIGPYEVARLDAARPRGGRFALVAKGGR